MVAYNFKEQFAGDVEAGRKRQTIRPKRKRGGPKPGCDLQHYTGMRTKNCRKLIEATCLRVVPVTVKEPGVVVYDGAVLLSDATLKLALADGFANVSAFIDFFRQQYGLPFDGELIGW